MPNSHSENTKRIAKNTMMLYCRMLFSMHPGWFSEYDVKRA